MSVRNAFLSLAALLLGVPALYVLGAWLHLYGEEEHAGEPTPARVPEALVAGRARADARAAAALTVGEPKQILFGDLHVHTTFSTDAFLWSLPLVNGEGAHPVADACDYARFCSGLDFWSINDHAEATSPRKWRETKQAIRQCDAAAGDPTNPDVAVFLGWEWSQVGRVPEEHWGHKNVILRQLADDAVPARPIGAAGIATDGLRGTLGGMPWYVPLLDFPERERYYDFIQSMDELRSVERCPEGVPSPELPEDCYESAATPRELFEKLDQWGLEAIVIPHGNTWGFYTPPGSTLDKQLDRAQHDPARQFLFEIMSGHGNSEEYRDWKAVDFAPDGRPLCPEPRSDYEPSCWRAGEIIRARCRAAGLDEGECESRAAEARQLHVEAGVAGQNVVPGVGFEEWLDAGQCRDCFLPSFNYRPGGSGQYALALGGFEASGAPRRFRFGFIASSDTHRARPGTGYKEFDREGTTESQGPRDETWRRRVFGEPVEKTPRATRVDTLDLSRGFATLEAERQASFFYTGGLAALHAVGRSRDAVWDALRRKEAYGTSGDRILLWFHWLNAEGADGTLASVPMGGEGRARAAPRFEVRAVGALRQQAGCPESSVAALGPEGLEKLCKGECHHPSDQRKGITRIEVVRIRPQLRPGEPVRELIEDPWRTLACEPSPNGCVVQFEDPDFAAAGRDTVYYVRAVEEPSPAVNAGNLRCRRDETGACLEVQPCHGDYRTSDTDDCTETIEERAWSSPIFVDAG